MVLYPLAYIILTLPLSAGRMWSMAHHEKSLPDAYQCMAGTLLASSGFVDSLLYTLTRKTLVQGNVERPHRQGRHVKFGNGKSSEDPNSSITDANGGITQTRTVTVVGQVFEMEMERIDEERGRPTKQNYTVSQRTGHSPTGSLDPIMAGGHLGMNSNKVGTEVLVTAAPIDAASDDDLSKSSLDGTDPKSSSPPKFNDGLKYKDYSRRS